MGIDPAAVGRTAGPVLRRWDARDTMLYALGVGAGVADLAFTTENTGGMPQRVLPTFGIVACGDAGALSMVGELDLPRLMHGAQSVRVFAPLPAAGELSVTSDVVSITDRGPGGHAVLRVRSRGNDPATGEPLVEAESTLVVRGAGGFGGRPGPPAERVPVPSRAPDVEDHFTTRPDQALLYRLSGDRNRLHSDPGFARKAGFDAPILHGLCTYGVAGRALLRTLCDDDPARFAAMQARFSAPVVPGETLVTSGWVTGDGQAVFRTAVADGDGRTVLADGRCTFRA